MDFNKVYLDDNLLYKIYNLLSFNDMITFSYINQYTYNNYKQKTKIAFSFVLMQKIYVLDDK